MSEQIPSGIVAAPNQGAAATSGQTEGGIYLPPGLAEAGPAKGGLYVPPGLERVANLPGAADDDVPTQPADELRPADFAKSSCRFCNGRGLVPKDNEELRAKEMVLCICVEKRMDRGLGPRSRHGKELVARQEAWYNENETDVHKEKDMNQRQIDEATAAAREQFKLSGDRTGYDAALDSLNAKQAELDASEVKATPEVEEPRISDAAQAVIDEYQLPLELFEGYSVVSVSVARRIAEQYTEAEEALSPEPAETDSYMLERDEEEILGETLDEVVPDEERIPYYGQDDPLDLEPVKDEPFEDEDDAADEMNDSADV